MVQFKKLLLGFFVFLLGVILIGCKNKTNTTQDEAQATEKTQATQDEPIESTNSETVITDSHVHEPSDWQTVIEASCSKPGEMQVVCKSCGEVLDVKATPKLEHTIVIDSGYPSSCTAPGLSEGSHCAICGEVIQEQVELPLIDHDYQEIERVDATISSDGYILYECSMCGDSYKVDLPQITDYNNEEEIIITLSDLGTTVTNNNGGVSIDNNTILITKAGEYVITGELLEGNIIIHVGDEEEVDLVLNSMTLVSTTTNPLYMENGGKLEISAKNGTKNTIKDLREYNSDATGAAIYSLCDTLLKGKGELFVSSTYNNGIHTKDDLKIKNLSLTVEAVNNALKGNDSLTIESGIITAISSGGDALKTDNSDISSKGNQRGTITINGGVVDLYSATDAIDASYDVIINDGIITINTDKYSSYSSEVTVKQKSIIYLKLSNRNLSSSYKFSALFYDEEGNTSWSTGELVKTGRTSYMKFDEPSGSKYVRFFCYSSSQSSNQDANYLYATDRLTINDAYDAYSITNLSSKVMSGSWTNYTTQGGPGGPGGPGGFDGNKDKTDYSCKGIKADNEIIINGGTININSTDDAIHANSDTLLETNKNGLGNVTINGGSITISTSDDAIHGDNSVTIHGGYIHIDKSYEGVEGSSITFNDGTIEIISSDDGINAKSTLSFKGGLIYLNANGDGIDSNGTVTMTGGIVLALGPTNGGNGVIDFDRSFSFSGGLLLAIGCSGMNQKPTAQSGNTSTSKSISTSTSSYVNVIVNDEVVATIRVTKNSQNYCVLAYNNTSFPNASTTITTTSSNPLVNGLYYVK